MAGLAGWWVVGGAVGGWFGRVVSSGRDSRPGDCVGEGSSTQVPLSSVWPLGQVHTGPLGLRRQSHSHFLRSQGLVTARDGALAL